MTLLGYPLRDYQIIWVNDIFTSWQKGNKKVLAQLACGGGKTVAFAHISNYFLERNKRILAIAHRIELIDQAAQKFREITGLDVGIIKGRAKSNPDALIQVASIQTLSQRKKLPENIGLIIIDEAHHASAATYRAIIDHYDRARVLGVTATPQRLDGQGFDDLFDDLVVGTSSKKLIKEGYLSKFRLFATSNTIDTHAVDKSHGDFNSRDLALAVTNQLSLSDIYNIYCQFAFDKSTIIYAASIAHSKEIARYFQENSINAEHLDGDTSPKERLNILQRFQSGTTKVLTNYEILIEGYDYSEIDCVFCIRPTQSATLWLQMTGRALRIGTSSKKVATIIDVTDNWRIHGLPDDSRQWSLTATSMPTTFRGAVRCEICTHIFRPLGSELEAMYADMGDDGLLVLHHQAVCPSCGADVYFTTREDERNHQRIRVRLKPGLIPEITEINLDVSSEIVTQAYWFVKSLHRQKLSTKETYEAIYKKFIAQIDKFTLGDWRKIVRIVEPGEFSSPTKKAWDLYQQGLVKHRNRLAAIAAIKQRQEQEKIKVTATQQRKTEPFKSSVVQVIKKPATLGNPVVKKQYNIQWILALSRCIESTRSFLTDHTGLWSVEERESSVSISIEIENATELKAKIKLIGEVELQEAFTASFGKKASVMFRLASY